MTEQPVVVTAPTSRIVTRDVVKKHCRIELDEDYENELLDSYVVAATDLIQSRCDLTFLQTTYDWALSGFPPCHQAAIYIPKGPLVSITSISYTDTAGSSQTFTDFETGAGEPSIIWPSYDFIWPQARPQRQSVVIRYVAGFADVDSVPQMAKQAVLLTVGHWFRNRELSTEKPMHDLPMAVDALCNQLRPGNEFA